MLNRKLLREMGVPDDAVERILSLHHEALDPLQTELDEARVALTDHAAVLAERDELRNTAAENEAHAARVQTELDDFRQQVHHERTEQGRTAALHEALRQAGANEQAIPLLAQAIHTTEDDWQDTTLIDAVRTLTPVASEYGAFFSEPVQLPTERCTPPLSPSNLLTREDLRAMTAEEINQNWSQVRQALQLPSNL